MVKSTIVSFRITCRAKVDKSGVIMGLSILFCACHSWTPSCMMPFLPQNKQLFRTLLNVLLTLNIIYSAWNKDDGSRCNVPNSVISDLLFLCTFCIQLFLYFFFSKKHMSTLRRGEKKSGVWFRSCLTERSVRWKIKMFHTELFVLLTRILKAAFSKG